MGFKCNFIHTKVWKCKIIIHKIIFFFFSVYYIRAMFTFLNYWSKVYTSEVQRLLLSLFLHMSLKPDVNTAQHTEYNGGSLRNVLTVVSSEDLPHWYSLAKIHAFGLEL